MGVQVDEAGRDDLAFDITHVLAREPVADRRHFAIREGNVGHLVERLRRIDDPSAFENQVIHGALYRILPMAFASAPARGRDTLSRPSQSAITRSSSRSGPATRLASWPGSRWAAWASSLESARPPLRSTRAPSWSPKRNRST